MNPTPGKDEHLMQSFAQSKRRMTPSSGEIKIEYLTPSPRTHSLRSIPISGKVEYPTQSRTPSKRPITPIPGKVACPSYPRIHSGAALVPIPEKADYFPSNNDKQDLNAAVEKASQEKRMATIAKLCTKCNCRDYIGWCKDCKACFDCYPDFIDI
ncbi:hypothetical protein BG015_004045 [Linnemannia schmuckeri]|uniref:Uncharacterized protein n=1 Tax=Linnemannia schmuckeri TaxID=64567 RepID=A0A9P5REV3_9FUNG|nr:hypothetical protein BG015_004045 [Linnemannia schmuckeri]